MRARTVSSFAPRRACSWPCPPGLMAQEAAPGPPASRLLPPPRPARDRGARDRRGHRLGEVRGVPRPGQRPPHPELRLFGEGAAATARSTSAAENVGRDDARYTLDYGVAGKYALLLDYNKIPHNFGNDGNLLWNAHRPRPLRDPRPRAGRPPDGAPAAVPGQPGRDQLRLPRRPAAPLSSHAHRSTWACSRDRTLARLDLGKAGPRLDAGVQPREPHRRPAPTAAASASTTSPSCPSRSTTTPPAPSWPASGTPSAAACASATATPRSRTTSAR